MHFFEYKLLQIDFRAILKVAIGCLAFVCWAVILLLSFFLISRSQTGGGMLLVANITLGLFALILSFQWLSESPFWSTEKLFSFEYVGLVPTDSVAATVGFGGTVFGLFIMTLPLWVDNLFGDIGGFFTRSCIVAGILAWAFTFAWSDHISGEAEKRSRYINQD